MTRRCRRSTGRPLSSAPRLRARAPTPRPLAAPGRCERCGCRLSRYRDARARHCAACEERAPDAADRAFRLQLLLAAGRALEVEPDARFRCPSCGGLKSAAARSCARCRFAGPSPPAARGRGAEGRPVPRVRGRQGGPLAALQGVPLRRSAAALHREPRDHVPALPGAEDAQGLLLPPLPEHRRARHGLPRRPPRPLRLRRLRRAEEAQARPPVPCVRRTRPLAPRRLSPRAHGAGGGRRNGSLAPRLPQFLGERKQRERREMSTLSTSRVAAAPTRGKSRVSPRPSAWPALEPGLSAGGGAAWGPGLGPLLRVVGRSTRVIS